MSNLKVGDYVRSTKFGVEGRIYKMEVCLKDGCGQQTLTLDPPSDNPKYGAVRGFWHMEHFVLVNDPYRELKLRVEPIRRQLLSGSEFNRYDVKRLLEEIKRLTSS